jgi:putative endonuclease
MESHRLGVDGEDAAADYLRQRGYEILARRYTTRGGELDIICCLREAGSVSLVVFVEVKTRRPTVFGRPEQAVSKTKMRNIYRTARVFIHEHRHDDVLCRFDVIAVYWIKGRLEIDHFEEAFGLGELMDMD